MGAHSDVDHRCSLFHKALRATTGKRTAKALMHLAFGRSPGQHLHLCKDHRLNY